MVWTLDNGPIILLQNHCVEGFQWKLKFVGTKTRSFSDQQAPCQSQMIPTEIQYPALFVELAIGIWHDYRWCFLEISYLFRVSVANLCYTTSLAARRRWQVNPIRWRWRQQPYDADKHRLSNRFHDPNKIWIVIWNNPHRNVSPNPTCHRQVPYVWAFWVILVNV